jgi:hypothetical protein
LTTLKRPERDKEQNFDIAAKNSERVLILAYEKDSTFQKLKKSSRKNTVETYSRSKERASLRPTVI